MGGLAGAAWARVAGRLHAFLAGSTPDTLTPCDKRGKAKGTPVPFVHERRGEGTDAVDDGVRSDGDLTVFVRVVLVEGALFAYDAKVWKLRRFDRDRAAGADWPHSATLERHAE